MAKPQPRIGTATVDSRTSNASLGSSTRVAAQAFWNGTSGNRTWAVVAWPLTSQSLRTNPWSASARFRPTSNTFGSAISIRLAAGDGNVPVVFGPVWAPYAKAFYAFEMIGNTEWWATYESYNGWLRWGLGMAQPSYPWPEVQHELGGARVYYVTKKYWDQLVKKYVQQMAGADLDFDVPDSVRQANEELIVPEEILV